MAIESRISEPGQGGQWGLKEAQARYFSNLHRGALWAGSDVEPQVVLGSHMRAVCCLLFPVDSLSAICQFLRSGSA